MNSNASAAFRLIAMAIAMSVAPLKSVSAHESPSEIAAAAPARSIRLAPATLVELDEARTASSRYLHVDAATADGYVDVGAFVPGMGWHYVNANLIDRRFEPERPEILVYADDPCSAERRLVALEYAVPLALSERAPIGFIGRADAWHANQELGLWTLHVWLWEYNPDGVFAEFNPRVP